MLIMSQNHKRIFDTTGKFLMITYDKIYDDDEKYLGLLAHISIYDMEGYRDKESQHFLLAEYNSVDAAKNVMEMFYECVRSKREIFKMPTKEEMVRTMTIS